MKPSSVRGQSKYQLSYRIPQALLAMLWLSGALGSILRSNGSMEVFHRLGYPDYFASMLGAAQLLAVGAILLPVPVVLREWAYAGLAFDSAAAITSLLATHSSLPQLIFPLTAFALVIVTYRSWKMTLNTGARQSTPPLLPA
ncbi:MAG TPA: DoxX family protein [Acidobacteriaceae bacterium]|jgi:hypothetical protein